MDNSRDVGVETLDAYPDQRARQAIAHLQSLRNELRKLRAMGHFIGPTQAAAQFSENSIIGAIISSRDTNAVLVAILFPNILFSTRWGRMTLLRHSDRRPEKL